MSEKKPAPGTFEFQETLPPLPVPDLDTTCAKYLKSVKCLLTPEEFKRTSEIVEKFRTGIGKTLHEKLLQRASENKNWLAEWWDNLAYFMQRDPLVINSNWYGLEVPRYGLFRVLNQTQRAAVTIYGLATIKEQIYSHTMSPDMLAGRPLCMNQFTRVFGANRTPGEPADQLDVFPESQHVAVFYKYQMYSLNIYQGSAIAPIPNIERAIIRIMDEVNQTQPIHLEVPVGVLTSQNRTLWAEARSKLREVEQNKTSLDQVEKSLFAICLDDTPYLDVEQELKGSFYGDTRNRWFDKAMQVIISSDGKAVINAEHSACDAPIVARIFEETQSWVQENIFGTTSPPLKKATTSSEKPVSFTKLTWNLDTEMKKTIRKAEADVDYLVSKLDATIYPSPYGSDYMKANKLSPDGFIQMAMQLAYYMAHNRPCLTYESAMTRLFYHGRTETIRTLDEIAFQFVQTMLNPHATRDQKLSAFKNALENHKEKQKECVLGQGCDRHLLGMRIIAYFEGLPTPEIFTDKAYNFPFDLATSQTPFGFWSDVEAPGGGFGPISPNGIGVSYMVCKRNIFFHITSWNTGTQASSKEFAKAIRDTFNQLKDLLEKSKL